MKHCPRCDEDLAVSEFGVCRARKDGLNLYCKKCIREKVSAFRLANHAYLAARRKPSVLATKRKVKRRINREQSEIEKVRIAVESGIDGQKQIRCATGLSCDAVSDALAVLVLDRREVRPLPLPSASVNNWNGENWKYAVVAA